jgi:hypothetical protein
MRASGYTRKNVSVKLFDGINTTVDENLAPLSSSPLSYNLAFSGGALTAKLGIEKAGLTILATPSGRHELPELPDGLEIKTMHLYRRYDFENMRRDDRLVVRSSDDTYYETKIFEQDTFRLITNMSAGGKDCSACYRYNGADVLLLASETGAFFTYDGTTATIVQNAPKLTSMCVHAERVFATASGEQNSVWFSADFNPENWQVDSANAGFINFDDEGGAALKVVAFANYVYVFREHSIMRLQGYGTQQDFAVTKLYVSSGRIYADTIAVCGDVMTFLAEDGLYVFDGYNVSAVCAGLKKFLSTDKSKTTACYLDGKYYLATLLDFGADNANKVLSENVTGFKNNCMVIYDLKKRSFSVLRGADIRHLLSINVFHEASVLACFYNSHAAKIGRVVENGKVFTDVLPGYWSSPETDLGYVGREKTVREIFLSTHTDCTLGVVIDEVTVEYAVLGSVRAQRISINRKGDKLRVYLKSAKPAAKILAPRIVVDVTR